MVKKGYEGKRLIVEQLDQDDLRCIKYLAGSKKTETLYMVNMNSDGEINTYKLATSAEELTKIRDLLIDVVSKIEKNYGLEQSVKIIKKSE